MIKLIFYRLIIEYASDHFFIYFRFIERQNNETDYLEIDLDAISCMSPVGRMGGKQRLRVGGCNDEQNNISYGMIIHELMHSLGKYHLHYIMLTVSKKQ